MHCQRTVVSILLFKGLFLFGILIFFNSKIPLNPYVYAEIKLKDNSIKNTTLTPTKILPKKQDHSFVNFQIVLSTYKLDFQNKNLYYYLRGFLCFGSSFFNSKIPLHPYVYAEIKLKDNSVKNTTLISTKILPKKQNHSSVNFQIILSTYKLDF